MAQWIELPDRIRRHTLPIRQPTPIPNAWTTAEQIVDAERLARRMLAGAPLGKLEESQVTADRHRTQEQLASEIQTLCQARFRTAWAKRCRTWARPIPVVQHRELPMLDRAVGPIQPGPTTLRGWLGRRP